MVSFDLTNQILYLYGSIICESYIHYFIQNVPVIGFASMRM